MGKILLDNLSISQVFMGYKSFDEKNTYIQNYIYSLVLWDEIICVQDSRFYEGSVRVVRTLQEEIDELNTNYINNKLGIYFVDEKLFRYKEKSHEIVSDMKIDDENIMIAEDVIRYILLGYNLGVNICLSPERTRFIKLEHFDNYIFDRLDVINMLENEVKDFYNEINNKIGKKIICFQSPLLFDYICKEAKDFNQALDMAIRMKNEKHIIEYRRIMDEMEDCLNKGNFVKFNEYLSIIPDIVNSIRTAGIKTQSFEIGLSPVPNISTNINLPLGRMYKNKLHMRFLKDLAKFGMTDRIKRI